MPQKVLTQRQTRSDFDMKPLSQVNLQENVAMVNLSMMPQKVLSQRQTRSDFDMKPLSQVVLISDFEVKSARKCSMVDLFLLKTSKLLTPTGKLEATFDMKPLSQ
ncbi:hypothetical protein KIN20_011896, partial [Parelaphostrongylus tenuis]